MKKILLVLLVALFGCSMAYAEMSDVDRLVSHIIENGKITEGHPVIYVESIDVRGKTEVRRYATIWLMPTTTGLQPFKLNLIEETWVTRENDSHITQVIISDYYVDQIVDESQLATFTRDSGGLISDYNSTPMDKIKAQSKYDELLKHFISFIGRRNI